MNQFMLTMHGNMQNWNTLGASEKQKVMEKYHAYVERLKSENRFKGGSALSDERARLAPSKSGISVDGPFVETKEILNGYFVFEAKDFAEAIEIAKDCPALTHGERVEIAPLTNH